MSNKTTKDYGHFSDEPATYVIKTLNLPTSWDYIYQNRNILLKVDQHGPVYAQAYPPSDIMLFRREGFQRYSSWLVWLTPDSFDGESFTNFYRPVIGNFDPSAQPDKLEITYTPTAAYYTIEHKGIKCVTQFSVPLKKCAICMKISLTNLRDEPLKLSATPALRPYVNPAMLAPWDRPEWYLKTAFCKEGQIGFSTRLSNMNSEPDKRRYVVLWSNSDNLTSAAISYEKFVGQGTWVNPQAVCEGKLPLTPADALKWGVYKDNNTLFGYPPVNALQYDIQLAVGQTQSFRQVLALLPNGPAGSMPQVAVAEEAATLLDDEFCRDEQTKQQQAFAKLANTRTINTPDAQLDRYVNQWLPLQMDWVCSLDRGWPSGMRGSRDSSNDFTAMVPFDPQWSREIIENLLECQRSDGWFPRQYSALGRKGKHDMRGHVDAGCWLIELLYEYLCFTKDMAVLDKTLPWLDKDNEDTVLDHALKTIDFFICDKNIGEHGLCKIGEGDWLDSVNRAGLKGRGESVMVSNQTIIAMTQMTSILNKLKETGKIDSLRADKLIAQYAQMKTRLRDNLRNHAYNKEGYFNSVFNDDGRWIFSDNDPDGERRVYGPANWFSIISGVAGPDLVESVLKELDFLKCEQGYRLCYPAMGKIPIDNVGRGGSGDMPDGLFENANAYNQGSHGFLGRALAVAGKGDLLYEVLEYLLPYDQQKHPTESTMTPPYGVVNCYQRVPGFFGRGGLVFLTGSIGYAVRIVYEWLFGIKPMLDGLAIDPCVPSSFDKLDAKFNYLGKNFELKILNPDGAQTQVKTLTLNGSQISETVTDPYSGRDVFVIADGLFSNEDNVIEVTL